MNKQYIINEIIRTAEENGGIPLGIDTFEKKTGIKYSDWYGKYWAKWGDAVKEAGYKPNKLQEAYDEEWIFEKLIEFIRDLHKFPTDGELRLKGRNNPNFPNHKTFTNRFGRKQNLIRRIIEYCSAKTNYKDVLDICLPLYKPKKNHDIEEDARIESESGFGFVYLMKHGKFYKIGRSNSSGRRNYELKIQMPEQVSLIHEIKTDDPVGIEEYWHKRFESKRKSGEWFELNSSDIKTFKRRKFM